MKNPTKNLRGLTLAATLITGFIAAALGTTAQANAEKAKGDQPKPLISSKDICVPVPKIPKTILAVGSHTVLISDAQSNDGEPNLSKFDYSLCELKGELAKAIPWPDNKPHKTYVVTSSTAADIDGDGGIIAAVKGNIAHVGTKIPRGSIVFMRQAPKFDDRCETYNFFLPAGPLEVANEKQADSDRIAPPVNLQQFRLGNTNCIKLAQAVEAMHIIVAVATYTKMFAEDNPVIPAWAKKAMVAHYITTQANFAEPTNFETVIATAITENNVAGQAEFYRSVVEVTSTPVQKPEAPATDVPATIVTERMVAQIEKAKAELAAALTEAQMKSATSIVAKTPKWPAQADARQAFDARPMTVTPTLIKPPALTR